MANDNFLITIPFFGSFPVLFTVWFAVTKEVDTMPKRRANGEGNIRKRKDGRWEGRYTAGYDPESGKRIIKNVLGKTQAEVKEKLKTAISESRKLDVAERHTATVFGRNTVPVTDSISGCGHFSIGRHLGILILEDVVHHLGHIVPIDGLVDVAVEVFTQRSLIQDTMLIQHVSVDFVPGALCALYVLICIERPGQECAEMGVGDAVAGLEGAVGITVGNAFVDCLSNLRVCPECAGNIGEAVGSNSWDSQTKTQN